MCNCITQVNEKLRTYATELGVSILTYPKVSVRVNILTFIPHGAKIRRGQKPMDLTATYCPFCGKKYEDENE